MTLNLPKAGRFALRTATLPAAVTPGSALPAREGLSSADLIIADGRIEAILADCVDVRFSGSMEDHTKALERRGAPRVEELLVEALARLRRRIVPELLDLKVRRADGEKVADARALIV